MKRVFISAWLSVWLLTLAAHSYELNTELADNEEAGEKLARKIDDLLSDVSVPDSYKVRVFLIKYATLYG